MLLDYTVYHEAKSKYAYIFDKETVHLRVLASKGRINAIKVLFGDPFQWGPNKDTGKWEWKLDSTDTTIMKKEYETTHYDHFFIECKPETLRMKYAFIINDRYLYGTREVIDLEEHPELMTDHFNYFNFPFLNEEDIFDAPSWVEDQIWYSIFPERFNNGDKNINLQKTLPWGNVETYSNEQRFGGDLQGIIDKLDYIKEIGFTGIYMTPIFKSDSTHKYDVNDYYKTDEAFGDNEKLGELVTKAHDLGLKVMLDAVFNHCGFRHPFFQDVIKNNEKSPYYDCFYIIDKKKPVIDFDVTDEGKIIRKSIQKIHKDHSLLNYRTFAFTPYMPKVNANNPIMKKHLIDAATYWITKYDIDGWRLDVSNEVSHRFWREFRTEVKKAKKDSYIVGENWDNSNPWLMGDQYDGVMNYEILFPIWNYFGSNIDHTPYTSTQFMYRINQVLTDYPKNVLKSLYNLVDSHDTTRILEICSDNIELVKLPYLFLFTFPGAPSIYYGGEIGLSGKHDPDNRRCMPWDKEHHNTSIKSHIQKLITLRNEYHAFKSTDYEWIETNDEKEFLIFKKEDLIFIMSKSNTSNTIKLPVTLQNRMYTDIYSETTVDIQESITVTAYGFYILKQK